MSVEDGFESLLGHDDDQITKQYKQGVASRRYNQRSQVYSRALIGSFSLILSIIIVLFFLQWNTAFEILGSNLREHSDPVMVTGPGPERDLKFMLYPEEHVSRDPGIRKLSWNITKATRAPDGVEKDVFLINGTSNAISPCNPSKIL